MSWTWVATIQRPGEEPTTVTFEASDPDEAYGIASDEARGDEGNPGEVLSVPTLVID